MLCISRYTDDTYAQQFGDGRHKFYLEFRCNRPCLKTMNTCAKCAEKSFTTLQHSRKFNHGNVDESIPDISHIFGGKWYFDGVRKWGSPPSEIIEFAIQYQKEARINTTINDSIEIYKEETQSIPQEMPRAKTTQNLDETIPIKPIPIKPKRKPKVANDIINENVTQETIPPKRTRKPKVAPDNLSEKKPTPRKKIIDTPYSTLVSSTNQLVHKEVALPTHIESQLEQIDSEGYEIEYIQLSLFEANGTTYYRDSKKNKLYKKIKDKGIGPYIGRWNPDTDSIVSNIPDSDNEE